jgi:hypothetical protein
MIERQNGAAGPTMYSSVSTTVTAVVVIAATGRVQPGS